MTVMLSYLQMSESHPASPPDQDTKLQHRVSRRAIAAFLAASAVLGGAGTGAGVKIHEDSLDRSNIAAAEQAARNATRCVKVDGPPALVTVQDTDRVTGKPHPVTAIALPITDESTHAPFDNDLSSPFGSRGNGLSYSYFASRAKVSAGHERQPVDPRSLRFSRQLRTDSQGPDDQHFNVLLIPSPTTLGNPGQYNTEIHYQAVAYANHGGRFTDDNVHTTVIADRHCATIGYTVTQQGEITELQEVEPQSANTEPTILHD